MNSQATSAPPASEAAGNHRAVGGVRRAARAAFAATLIAGAVLGAGATGAEAKTLPPGYQPNGCTLSPDSASFPVYYDFKQACNRHDYCYDELWYGGGENGRLRCDDNFHSEMRTWCSRQYAPQAQAAKRDKCYGVASVYYKAVRKFGASYFDNPNKN